jgi:hypothetical protein
VLRLPESPRRRRQLIYAAVALAAIVVLAAVQAAIGNTPGMPTTKPRPGKAQVWATPKTVEATEEAKRAAAATLEVFVRSAVIRRDLERSWRLATPHMKQDTTHSEWLRGTLPVVPYPAEQFRTASLTLRYSYRGILGYDVLVLPKKTLGMQEVYSCELHDVHGRWLVDFCYPRKTL